MTRPTGAEAAALLRELLPAAMQYGRSLETGEPGDHSIAAIVYDTVARARAMAEKLQPEDQS